MKDFKFGLKLTNKTIGEFDVGHPSQWNLMIKPQFKDDTLFVHFICHFKRALTDEEKANGVTEPPMKMDIVQGFLKDSKFVPESKNSYTSFSEASLLKTYERYIKEFTELGYIKHGEMYLGKQDPTEPKYHEAGSKGGMIDIQKMMGNIGLGTIPVGPANNPPKNPLLKLKMPQKVAVQQPNTNNP